MMPPLVSKYTHTTQHTTQHKNMSEPMGFGEKMRLARAKAKADREAGLRPEIVKKKHTKRRSKKREPPEPPKFGDLDSDLWDRTRDADFERAAKQRDARIKVKKAA